MSLLSLNVSEAFDNISHTWLLHNMQKRKVLIMLLNWVRDFLRECRTNLMIDEYTLSKWQTEVRILQDSFLSLILYLFYNVNLLENCDDIRLHTSITDFVNDVNILTYSDSTERNCKKLKEIYYKCERWYKTHDSHFNINKCELIHFSRMSQRYNMKYEIELINHQISAKADIRVLSVQLNLRLQWQLHVRQLQVKLVTQIKIIQTLTEFTWEASVEAE